MYGVSVLVELGYCRVVCTVFSAGQVRLLQGGVYGVSVLVELGYGSVCCTAFQCWLS